MFLTMVSTPSNLTMDGSRVIIDYFDIFLRIFPALVALWVAWSNQRFNNKQRKKNINIKYCEKYIDSCIILRKSIVDMELQAYELMQNSDNSLNAEKAAQLQLLRNKAIVISNEVVYDSVMVKKIFPKIQVIKFQDIISNYGVQLFELMISYVAELTKQEKPREYINNNYETWAQKVVVLSNNVKLQLAKSIDEVQNEILKL